MYRGPETERKLSFMLARQLHLQDTAEATKSGEGSKSGEVVAQQQRPFPETTFGRLPGEIRDMIYEYLLVAPPSQSTIYLRVPLIAATNSDITPVKRATVVTDPKDASTGPPHLAPVQNARPLRVSRLAILQTCRQINHEAYHIFYARNSFHFSDAECLINFLSGIGAVRRAELTSLHLEGLVVDQPLYPKALFDKYWFKPDMSSVERERVEAQRCLAIHPDISVASTLLDNCKNLSRLVLDMRTSERFHYFSFLLKRNIGMERQVVYLVDRSRWVVRLPCRNEDGDEDKVVVWKWKPNLEDYYEGVWKKWRAYEVCYLTQDSNKLFPVVVDIIRGPEEALGEGYQSWVAFR